MNPTLASLIFACGIAFLFWLNWDPTVRTSRALWIPVVWVLIAGSRPPTEWFSAPLSEATAGAVLESGNPLERNLFSVLLVLALSVLIVRGPRVRAVLRDGGPLLMFLGYCAVSLLWSDYADVGFKRWIKLVGDVGMVLVIVTDGDPTAAVDRVLTRVGFVIAPVSILFIRYYPQFGRNYDIFTGGEHWTGVTDNKNTLGLICMIIGIAALWRLLRELRCEGRKRRKGTLIAHGIVLTMVVYLLYEADSATSKSGLFFGGGILAAVILFRAARKPALIHVMVAFALAVSVGALFFNVGNLLKTTLGRNSTLTGRTDLWGHVLAQPVNRILGSGYEGFWLGPRLATIWRLSGQTPVQSHNGYIEILVNLGWVGLMVLGIIIANGYWKIIKAIRVDPERSSLMLGVFVATLLYNCTEAAFKMTNPVWIFFVWAVVAASGAAAAQRSAVRSSAQIRKASPAADWYSSRQVRIGLGQENA